MRIVRIAAGALTGALVLTSLLSGAWAVRERVRDPLAAIRRGGGQVRVLRDSSYEGTTASGERRLFRDLTLGTESAGTIRLTTSRPAEWDGAPLPLAFVLGGLRTGRDALAFVDTHGPNLLVGYEYPYSQQTWYESAKPFQIPAIRAAVLSVPAQVTLARRHLAAEGTDPARSALLGYSFGALFVPGVQRLASEDGAGFDALVLAYGGADVASLLDANIKLGAPTLRRALAWTGATLVRPMEPALHLPHLEGSFLVIRGERDEKIPSRSSRRLAELTPEPKEVVSLQAGHMGPHDPELTASVVRISQDWLARNGFVDPPSDPQTATSSKTAATLESASSSSSSGGPKPILR